MRVETVVIPEHTVTTYYYKYSELSEEAKEKANRWYLEGQDAYFFSDDCHEDLSNYWFPNSDVKVHYSLGYCQGDFLNFYGTLKLNDLWERIKEKFTEKEQKFINWIMRDNFSTTYKFADREYDDYDDTMDDIREELEGWYVGYPVCKNVKWDVVDKFEKEAGEFLRQLASEYKEDGYNFFYEVPDDIADICDDNGWEFSEEGEMIA